MKRYLASLLTAIALAATTLWNPAGAAGDHPRVRLQTSMGDIVLELDREKAPKTVDNFLRYVTDGFYDGTIFHRVIPEFVIQGGGYTPDFKEKPTRSPIPNEAKNGLFNDRGTIAMARTANPNSAASQFYINLANNINLNAGMLFAGEGYAVFGRVVQGMEVVDKIAAVPTGKGGPFPGDVPRTTVTITRATVVTEEKPPVKGR